MSTEIIAQWRSKIQSGSEELVQIPISVYFWRIWSLLQANLLQGSLIIIKQLLLLESGFRIILNPGSGLFVIQNPWKSRTAMDDETMYWEETVVKTFFSLHTCEMFHGDEM